MNFLSTISNYFKWIVGIVAAVGSFIAVTVAYFRGRKDQKDKQKVADAKYLEKIQREDAKSKPSSSDDRNSMRDGEF